MAECYAPDARFSDEVFVELRGDEIGGMWTMLCERGKDLRVEYEVSNVSGDSAEVRWQAWYTFAATGRPVHNIIDATLRVESGLIVDHRDAFNFYRWSRMALGGAGLLLGWTPLLKNKVRRTARGQLEAYLAKHR